jgi:hypothetical protein
LGDLDVDGKIIVKMGFWIWQCGLDSSNSGYDPDPVAVIVNAVMKLRVV